MKNINKVKSGLDVVNNTRFRFDVVGKDGKLIEYKVVLYYEGKQFTFAYKEMVNIRIDLNKIIYDSLNVMLNFRNVRDFEAFFKRMNYESEDLEFAKEDYKYGMRLIEGFNRVYGKDMYKLMNYFGF